MEPHGYQLPDLFPAGTAHHAAELGSVQALLDIEHRQRQLRGLPPLVVLEERDELLQCMPLHVASEHGHLDAVKHILSHGVDVDAADAHQVRPLHLAAINNHTDVVKLLADKGANQTKQDADGDLPVHWAATKGHVEMLEMLLDRGAPVDAHNKAGWTPLHRAAYNGRTAACQLLLRRGASIRAVTRTGCTALHLAASNNHLGVIELLLQLGACTCLKDHQGATCTDMCISDAARGLIQDKQAAHQRQQGGGTSAQQAAKSSRPSTSSGAAASKLRRAPAPNITHVPAMPRYTPAANANLDADGFPTTTEGGLPGADELSEPQLLLVDAGGRQAAEDGEEDGPDGAGLASAPLSGTPSSSAPLWADQAHGSAAADLATRRGHLSRQSSKQQPGPAALLASPSFGKGAGKPAGGPMQRFLKHYSLEKKGLFGL